MSRPLRIIAAAVAVSCGALPPVLAAPPAGFQKSTVVSGVAQPTSLAFAPDGRLFVLEKTGRVRLVKQGVLQAAPFLDVTEVVGAPAIFDDYSERGLLGIALHPAFPAVPRVYLYYSVCPQPGSATCPAARNRVARVTAGHQGDPDRADPASHVVVLDDIASPTGIHNAGWLGFGPLDGKLYVAVGDAGTGGGASQQLGSLNGKILRLEPDGGAPPDNPFVGVAGARPEVWALGLRNPWRCRFDPAGRLFCGDVGQAAWEEIDLIVPGGNYGWPWTEGDFDQASWPQFVRPVHVWAHPAGGSVTMGDFGARTAFPAAYRGGLFVADFSKQWIRHLTLGPDGTSVVSEGGFESAAGYVTDLIAGPDGALYYTDFIGGRVDRIAATGANRPPQARAAATPSSGAPPLVVLFSSEGSTDPDGDPLTVSWDFGDGSPLSTDPAPVHTYQAAGAYTARLTVSDGRAPVPGTDTATLSIVAGTPPVVTIAQPVAGTLFEGGQVIPLAGSATDTEDGPLDPSALRWEIRFHHDDHWHPYLNELAGSPQSFVATALGHTDANVSYRVILRATDSSGLTGEASLFIEPRVVILRLETEPSGLAVTLEGQPMVAPLSVPSVVGVQRVIGAPSPQGVWTFAAWSDGGDAEHAVTTPAVDTTYTAAFTGPTTTSSTTSTSTTTTTTATTTGSNSSTTATSATTVSSSTRVETTATTTTAPGASSTSTTTTVRPVAPSSTTMPDAPTSTTIPPRCGSGVTLVSVGCRIEALRTDVAVLAAGEPARVATVLQRRLSSAAKEIGRASVACEAGRVSRARAASRAAVRRMSSALSGLRGRPGRRAVPAPLAALDLELRTLLADLRGARQTLACP